MASRKKLYWIDDSDTEEGLGDEDAPDEGEDFSDKVSLLITEGSTSQSHIQFDPFITDNRYS